MGRKLDLSGLSDNEAEHVLQVVQRDMRLRKKEEQRLSELKQALDEEGSRCLLLSRQRCFNQRCCIRCCAPFSFLLNPKRRCDDCLYSVCKACRLYSPHHKAWLCSACQKSRLLKKQSLEWFYAHVKVRFKRFGSAKVLKTIYRRHLAEHSVLAELTEGSTYEDSICNEGSVCGSDATFYRQTEEHSMAESLTVALRVAEEAIDEAICNAEIDTATQQEKQNEAHYLREHRAELIQELAKTIMQKIISGRKTLADTRDKCEQDGPLEHDPELHRHGDQAGSTFKHLKGLWRSQSAFSLLDDNLPAGLVQDALQALHKDEDRAAGTTWTSVERLENSGVSSMLKSPDGNWIALQSSQLSRPSLLAKRKSLVYSALERESGAVSAYEAMDSDNEAKPEPDSSWGAILQEVHRKMTGSKVRRPARNRAPSDSERSKKSPLDSFNKRGAAEPKRAPWSRRTSIMDVDFNVKTEEEEEEEEEEGVTASEAAVGKAKRTRKKRRSKRRATLSGPPLDFNRKDGRSGSPSDAETPDPLTPDATTPSLLGQESDAPEHQVNQESSQESMSDSSLRDEANDAEEVEMRSEDDDEENERTAVDLAADKEEEEEVKARLYKLVAQSRLAYFSSTDDELDRAGRSEEDGGCDEEDKTERLSHKLCRLEEEVRAAMLSSTEDELDRVTDEEELAVKVCRLATQVGATQFSSTEDELDREEVMHEETLWRLQEDKAAPAAQVRHLASLVSASQFSSTEDELDRVGEDEAELDQGGRNEELSEDAVEERRERLESMGDVEVDMFALSQQNEDMRENLLDPTDQYGEVNVEESNGGMAKDILLVSDMDKRTSMETIIRQEDQAEVKMFDQREERQEEDQDILGGGEELLLGTKLETASVSEDEDAEFDRVISSMLTMRLEEMQKDINLDQRLEDIETDEETNEELETENDTKADNESKYDTKTEEERKEDANTDVKTKEDFKTDYEWKEDTRTDKSKNEFPVTEQDNNKVAKTEEMTNQEKEDSKTNTNITEEPKTDNEKNQVENTDSEKEDDSKTDEEVKEHEKTDKDKDQDAKMDKERKGHSKTDKDRNEDQKADGEKKEDTKTSEARNEDGQTEKDTQTDQERKGLEDRQDKEKIDDTKTGDGKKDDKETITDKNEDEKYKERKKDKKEIQKYSAGSLCSISTEVLKVLNATEELLQEVEGRESHRPSTSSLPDNADPKKLERRFSQLEEKVYVAAGSVYGVEAELSQLEERARDISSTTSEVELSFLEEQVASAAARVQQSEQQISDISARIAALRSAGLNVDPQSRVAKTTTVPVMPLTLNSSRQLRRRMPAVPRPEDKMSSP